jgi:DnaK suppressor protein
MGKKYGSTLKRIRRSEQRDVKSYASYNDIEARLYGERNEVYSSLISSSSLPADELVDGWQERDSASEQELRDIEYSHRGLLRQRLYQIDEAIERVKNGTYGLCIECESEINPKRLEVNPSVSLCLTCQSAVEEVEVRRRSSENFVLIYS